MGDRSISRWQRRRTLSDDVRHRRAVTVTEAARQAPLPWARPRGRSGPGEAETGTADSPVIRRAVQDNVPGDDRTTEEGEGPASTGPSPQQVADRVYQLMCEDLRLERERKG
jgi:hypothetical protein